MPQFGLRLPDAWVLAIVGVAIGAVLPPLVLRAREESLRDQCASRLGEIARGALRFADANGGTLPSNRRQPFASWNTLVLPFVGRQDLFDQYELADDWWQAANRKAGAQFLPELTCPTAPHGDRRIKLLAPDGHAFDAAATDYVASAGAYLYHNTPEQLYRGAMASPGRFYGASMVTADRAVRLAEIADGPANSLLIVEMADKPNQWRAGKLHADELSDMVARPLVEGFSFGQWVAPNWNHLRAYTDDGAKAFGPCAVNCSNGASIYSFHAGGANAAFADGSVRRLRAGLDEDVLVALVSIADGELVALTDYVAK